MRIARTLPPAAAPISLTQILRGTKAQFSGSSETDKFRDDLKHYFQVEGCFLLSSGKAALTILLQGLKDLYPERNEVLIPAFTCYSVPSAIARAGLKVKLADIVPETLDYDFHQLNKKLNKKDRLLAALSTHLFGLPADTARLRETLNDPEITIVEDAAQAMGNMINDQFLGTNGEAGFFSLGRGKAYTTVEGGIIITNSLQLNEAINASLQKGDKQKTPSVIGLAAYASILSLFTHPSFFWLPKSIPALKLGETAYEPDFSVKKFSSFQAGLAMNWKKELSLTQKTRRQNAKHWSDALAQFPWMQPVKKATSSVYPLIRFPVLIKSPDLREKVLDLSEKRGLGIMPVYPDTIDTIADLKLDNLQGQSFPGAKACASQLITFPVHEFVTAKDQKKTVDCLKTVTTTVH